jgi:hypothetical protein
MRERQVGFGMHPSQRPLEERQAAQGEELPDIQTPETISVDLAWDYYSPPKTTAGQGREKRRNTNQVQVLGRARLARSRVPGREQLALRTGPPPIWEAFQGS